MSQSLRYQVTPSDTTYDTITCTDPSVSQSLRYQVTPSDRMAEKEKKGGLEVVSQSLRYQVTPSDVVSGT